MGLDGAQFGVLQFPSDEPVRELARLNVEWRDVAGHLFSGLVSEHDFQYPVRRVVWPRADEHDEVRRHRDRWRTWRWHREHDPREVDASRRPRHLAEVEALDKKSRNYVHRERATDMGGRVSTGNGARSDQFGLAFSLSVGFTLLSGGGEVDTVVAYLEPPELLEEPDHQPPVVELAGRERKLGCGRRRMMVRVEPLAPSH